MILAGSALANICGDATEARSCSYKRAPNTFPPLPPLSHSEPSPSWIPPLGLCWNGMKRNRAEPAPSKAPETPAKTQRRSKDPSPKGPGTVRSRAGAAPPEKPRKGGGSEKRPSAAAAAAAAVDSSPIAVAMAQEGEEEERPLGWDEFGGWWWWGVEEEMLLGWFPFVEEDFLCSENRGGSGLFWEEGDHDIWQLQDIHEIPNQAK